MHSLYKQGVAVLFFTALSGCAAPGYHYVSTGTTKGFEAIPDNPCELSFVNKPVILSWLNSSIGKPNGVSEKVISIRDSSDVDRDVLWGSYSKSMTCHGTLVFANGNTASGFFAYSTENGIFAYAAPSTIFAYSNPGTIIVTWTSDAELAKKKEEQHAQAVQHEQQQKLASPPPPTPEMALFQQIVSGAVLPKWKFLGVNTDSYGRRDFVFFAADTIQKQKTDTIQKKKKYTDVFVGGLHEWYGSNPGDLISGIQTGKYRTSSLSIIHVHCDTEDIGDDFSGAKMFETQLVSYVCAHKKK